jgi:23S rRNA pseudouridine1911/1915/1917 synthase
MKKSQQLTFVVTTEMLDERIDKALARVPEIGSRSQALKLLQMGAVRKSGKIIKPSYKTIEGDVFDLNIPIIENEKLLPYDFPLNIVFEDKDLIVLNKPAGLVVHPACGHTQDTLVNALLHYTTDLSLGYNEKRPGIVHRIDKGTSGLLVIAKNDQAQRVLAQQFQRKTTHRVYYAIAYGVFKESAGTIRSYLRRHPENRQRVLSSPEEPGRLSITHYKVLKVHEGISLLELRLETGRTHQIRAHLSELGHPILGDLVYGSNKRSKNIKSLKIRSFVDHTARFALHAAELGFEHPTTHEKMIFKVGWPDDLAELVGLCGFN